MDVPLQITFRDTAPSEALESRIRERVTKLEEFHPRITSCRVTIEQRGRRHQHGGQFNVRLDLRVPQHEIAINRDHDEDVYVALREAFDAATRTLEDMATEGREAKRAGGRHRGTDS